MPTERTNRLKGTLDLIPENSSADFGSRAEASRSRELCVSRPRKPERRALPSLPLGRGGRACMAFAR